MPEKTETPPVETLWENPLIPNKRLRQLYTAMVELRLLESHLSRNKKATGEEAIRVSTTLSLLPSDLTSEPAPNSATAFLRSAKLSALNETTGQLPAIKDPAARLHIAIGAALARATKKNSPLVLAYIHSSDLNLAAWKPILRLASAHAAPILFVILSVANNPGQLSLASTKYGVPGIPVDAADAVALYRVAQESILRIRSGGGPVLMECILFHLPGRKTQPPGLITDPILNMRESLLRRQLADQAWLNAVPNRFAARLKAPAL